MLPFTTFCNVILWLKGRSVALMYWTSNLLAPCYKHKKVTRACFQQKGETYYFSKVFAKTNYWNFQSCIQWMTLVLLDTTWKFHVPKNLVTSIFDRAIRKLFYQNAIIVFQILCILTPKKRVTIHIFRVFENLLSWIWRHGQSD